MDPPWTRVLKIFTSGSDKSQQIRCNVLKASGNFLFFKAFLKKLIVKIKLNKYSESTFNSITYMSFKKP